MKLALTLAIAGLAAAAAPSTSTLEQARDRQDRAVLQQHIAQLSDAAAKAPKDAAKQYQAALAYSYLAEVMIEQHERKPARQMAEKGIKAAEQAVALDASAENYRLLGTLCGQAITDLMSGLSYGAKAKDALNKAIERAPKSSQVWVAHGVGNYYLPAQLGGGTALAIADFNKAIALDAKNADAYLWLGVALRKDNKDAEARKALAKALELNPNRVWVKQQLEKTPAK